MDKNCISIVGKTKEDKTFFVKWIPDEKSVKKEQKLRKKVNYREIFSIVCHLDYAEQVYNLCEQCVRGKIPLRDLKCKVDRVLQIH